MSSRYILLLLILLLNCTSNNLNDADELLKTGDFLGARQLYERYVEKKPSDFAGHFGLGMSWCAEAIYKTELGLVQPTDWYQAIYHVSIASNLGGGDEVKKTLAILHYNLGASYRKNGNNVDAAARIEQSLVYDSTLLKALNLLGAISHETGDIDKAEECYKRAVALFPNYAMAHFNLGAVAWAKGDYHGAFKCFEQSAKLEPQNAHFLVWCDKAKSKADDS